MRIGIAVVTALLAPSPAAAFCGFYIDTGGGEMYSNATQVVLMRDGTRTVLSMQNNYEGPLQDFALVIPVPTVLKQSDVKTLPKSIFARVNAMSAPRLVEYWEQDPCYKPEGQSVDTRDFAKHASGDDFARTQGVTIEAKFDVDEYQIVILSAKDSTGLERYLRGANYKIPAGAAPLLRPYVESGSKFFVARVDPKKVKYANGKATLSPLRVHYDSDELALPIRLGLANSAGTQDLIINILASNQRYEVANYPNAFIPTNLDVVDGVRARFGEFYAALFDRTVQMHPGAVITEYSWAASSCDPCPGILLDDDDFRALGEEVLVKPPKPPPPPPPPPPKPPAPGEEPEIEIDFGEIPEEETRDFVLTRLHARYGTSGAPSDLVFRAAPPISGGRERRGGNGALDTTATPASANAFQGRYIIRHAWTGEIDCPDPVRNIWGGKGGMRSRIALAAATDSAEAPRGKVELQLLVAQDVPEISVRRGLPLNPPLPAPVTRRARQPRGCGCGTTDGLGWLGLAGLVIILSRRSHRGRA